MEQIKCGEVYRDIDGNFNYICTCCSFEFMSPSDFEDHVNVHISLSTELIKSEEIVEDLDVHHTKRNISIQIEPVLLDKMDNIIPDDGDGGSEDEANFEETEFIIESTDDVHDVFDSFTEESVFKCNCCDKSYACRGLRQQHIHKFLDNSKSCDQCPAYYEKEAELNAHKKVHNLANTLDCPHCMETFASINKLKRHLTSSKSEMGLPPAKRPRKSQQTKIKENDAPTDYEDEKLIQDDDFEIESGDKKRQKFVCKICRKEYSYLHYLKKHLKRHSDNTLNHACEICGHEFKLRQNLTAHMRTHTGEKPFKCRFVRILNQNLNKKILSILHSF